MPTVQKKEWELFLSNHPDSHLLQKSQWGKFKQRHGWYPKFIVSGKVGAQVLFRNIPLKRTIAYVPKGPVGDIDTHLLDEIELLAKRERAILVYIEPDEWQECPICNVLLEHGYDSSQMTIQPRQTITISLDGEQEVWLKRMKQKTRYNIRLAQKKDVCVEVSDDIDSFSDLMKITGNRDEFGIHDPQYYRDVYQKFSPDGSCVLLLAKYDQQDLAGIMVFKRGRRAWYFYGASNNQERNRMPTYLLQWEAMKWAAQQGCQEYDLWGIPDEPQKALESQFTSRSDGLWGVYRFKRGFGGEIKRTAGVFQKVLDQPFYFVYQLAMKFRKSVIS